MIYLFELEIQTFPNGDACERYGIGVFQSRNQAEETAKRYLREVKGFRDYYCEYSILKTELVGSGNTDIVHTWYGWNVDEDANEIDLLSGLFYEDADKAEAAMAAAKAANDRQEWTLSCFQIGKCEWSEGFIRDYPDGRIAPTLAELRAGLHALIVPRAMCGIEYEYCDNVQYGFPLAVGQALFLMAVDDDFLLNGFTVRRLRDIYEICERKGMYQTIAQREGLTNFEVPKVDITDWEHVFRSLQALGKTVIVEREYEPDFFRLGRIEEVEKDHVLFRHVDADGAWQEPARIGYREITSVAFDDRYANTFSKYV